jgi:hypothetical protein
MRLAAVLACAGCLLQGCASDARFGARHFRQEKNFNGLPTYSASGTLPEWEKAGPVATDVMVQACPDGNPTVLNGNASVLKGRNANGMPFSIQFWDVVFTCEKAIPGLSAPEE